MDPIPQSEQPLPKVVEGVVGRNDSRNLRDIVGETPAATIRAQDGLIALDYGLGNQNTLFHYSDSLVDLSTVNQYPIRPTGWLTFTAAGGGGFRCTAQLISRSVGVTAGHCVHQGGDKVGIPRDQGWVTNATFTPAYINGAAPFGSAAVTYLTTTSGWYNTGALDQGYDVAVFTLAKRSGTAVEIGEYTGYYSFCSTHCLQNYWYNTQLGYAGNYYGGQYMTRGEHLEASDGRDFVFGSGMEGGSSGGGHIANLGYLDASAGSAAVPFRASLEIFKGDLMNGDLIKLPKARTSGDAIMSFEQRKSTRPRTASTMPPSFLIDEIAREEWERVAASLFDQGPASLAKRSLLAGYCNAVARAVRAEHTLTVEGRYYETRTRRGSLMRRRHPAAQDAEEGWTAARHLAKQLGLIGGSLGERRGEGSRRRVFK